MLKKKLAIFVAAISGGGVEKAVVNLANEIAKKGINIDLLIADDTGISSLYFDPNISVIKLSTKRVFFCIPELILYLIRAQPDVLFSAMEYVNFIALVSKKISFTSTRVIISSHAPLVYFIRDEKFFKWRLLKKLLSYLYGTADKVITVSKGLERSLIGELNINPAKILTIYNPIINESLINDSLEDLSDPWVKSSKSPYIISIGRFAKEKDYPTLINAFNLVREKRDVRLVILGQGPEWENVNKIINFHGLSSFVHTPGFVLNPYKYIKNAACFILSSKNEGFGNVLVEALALGCPIVSTNCEFGPVEVLENGLWGSLVPVGDYESMANSVLTTLDLNQSSSESLLNTHLDQFKVSVAVEKYINVFFPNKA
jgi:glycosyltransferase involved in cell wall biosynthesis